MESSYAHYATETNVPSGAVNQVAVQAFGHAVWSGMAAPDVVRNVTAALERGDVVFLPNLRFGVSDNELPLCSPGIVGASKNVGFDPSTGKVGGTVVTGDQQRMLADMLMRFSNDALALVAQLLLSYAGRVTRGRTSFRPVEIEGRKTSWRKDDTRLHIDAFP